MYEKIVLPNGLRILLEYIPYVRSTSVGIWIYTGSMHEESNENGISHFLEHMTFKGTKKRTAAKIAQEIDAVGGHLDGMTSREFTCFYAKVLDSHTILALDVLGDMFLNSIFPQDEIVKERRVVIEEIKMYEDSPDEYVHDSFVQSLWKDHPLGRPILGTREIVSAFDKQNLVSYSGRQYQPHRIILSIAGNFNRDEVEAKSREIFEGLENRTPEISIDAPNYNSGKLRMTRKELQQVHLCIGTKGLSRIDPDRFSFYVLNTLFGGGMSSRLFQEVREKRGLAYSIYSYLTSYKLAGAFTVYCGSSPKNYENLIRVILDQFNILCETPVPDEELRRSKEQFKGSLMLSLESTDNRMTRMAKLEMYFNNVPDLDATLKNIDSVTAESIQKIAQRLFDPANIALAAIGPETPEFLESNIHHNI